MVAVTHRVDAGNAIVLATDMARRRIGQVKLIMIDTPRQRERADSRCAPAWPSTPDTIHDNLLLAHSRLRAREQSLESASGSGSIPAVLEVEHRARSQQRNAEHALDGRNQFG